MRRAHLLPNHGMNDPASQGFLRLRRKATCILGFHTLILYISLKNVNYILLGLVCALKQVDTCATIIQKELLALIR